MTATIIDGRAIAERLRRSLAAHVEKLKENVCPGLAVILVGDDPASHIYVNSKTKQAAQVGIQHFDHRLPATATTGDLIALVRKLNERADVHGILVQLPLPDSVDAEAVLAAVDPDKDVDGFHPINAGRLALGQDSIVPCTPLGSLILIRSVQRELAGKRALVVGRSNIVGKPMAQLLLRHDCTVTLAHSRTRDLAAECNRADIIVAAVGRPHMLRGEWIRPGAIVIDVGINRIEGADGKSKVVGDVEFATAAERASAITPVPGGVGPMTIACLLMNTVNAAIRARFGADGELVKI